MQRQEMSQRIDGDVHLAPLAPLVPVVAGSAAALWRRLSRGAVEMTALGSGSRPSLQRSKLAQIVGHLSEDAGVIQRMVC
jgi:hypothetical protein